MAFIPRHCRTLNQSGECAVSGNINTLPKKVKQKFQGGGGLRQCQTKCVHDVLTMS